MLGPSDLYKLTKEIGKFVQNIRSLGSDLTKTVENNLESQLQLDELRKAQRELNDAFSFRRSINNLNTGGVEDGEEEGFGLRAVEKEDETTAAAAAANANATATAPAPVKKIRKRRVKKVVPEEESQVPNGGDNVSSETTTNIPDWEASYNTEPSMSSSSMRGDEWSPKTDDWSPPDYDGMDTAEQRRFQAQMNVETWNAQVMAQQQQQQPPVVGEEGQPSTSYQSFVLTKVMERLELLEEEKNAADALLQEEFRLRADTEEKYYREKRQILEEAVVELEQGETIASGPTTTNQSSMETAASATTGSPNTSTIA